MAKIIEWNEEQKKGWAEWVATRPPAIQEMCASLPPDRLYVMKSTGRRVTLEAYAEDGTLTVHVSHEYNPGIVLLSRSVFGIKPEGLEECDLP